MTPQRLASKHRTPAPATDAQQADAAPTEFEALAAECKARALVLWASRGPREARRMGGFFWVTGPGGRRAHVLQRADSLADLQAWLHAAEPGEVHQ